MLPPLCLLILIAAVVASCQDTPAPPKEARPAHLLNLAKTVDSTPISELRGADGFSPGSQTHRFFRGRHGYSLGVDIAFSNPAPDSRLKLHFDESRQGAADQMQQLRKALAPTRHFRRGPTVTGFCSTKHELTECVALDGNVIVGASSAAPVAQVRRLLHLGIRYQRRVINKTVD